MFRGTQDHVKRRIACSGSKAQYKGDTRNQALGSLCLRGVFGALCSNFLESILQQESPSWTARFALIGLLSRPEKTMSLCRDYIRIVNGLH